MHLHQCLLSRGEEEGRLRDVENDIQYKEMKLNGVNIKREIYSCLNAKKSRTKGNWAQTYKSGYFRPC